MYTQTHSENMRKAARWQIPIKMYHDNTLFFIKCTYRDVPFTTTQPTIHSKFIYYKLNRNKQKLMYTHFWFTHPYPARIKKICCRRYAHAYPIYIHIHTRITFNKLIYLWYGPTASRCHYMLYEGDSRGEWHKLCVCPHKARFMRLERMVATTIGRITRRIKFIKFAYLLIT